MRIKKYQKIICLGLALLSIIVFPCYAIDYLPSSEITIQRAIYNDETGKWDNEPLSEAYIDVFNIDLPKSLKLQYVKSYYYEIYPKTFYAISTVSQNFYIGIIRLKNAGNISVTDSSHNKQAEFIYNSNTFNLEGNEIFISIYRLNCDVVLDTDLFGETIYYCRFGINSNSDWGYINQYILFREIDEAVFNITTYTNLLIQNFEKAFTFITGSALPWVLLGITISLITYGIHTSKRIL